MFKWVKMKRRKEQWFNLMCVMKLNGFNLVNEKAILNGHVLTIAIPPTSSFKEFQSKKDNFQSYFKGIVEMEEVRFSNLLQMKVITHDIGKYEFEPVKPPTKTSIYVGKTFDGKPYFIDLKKSAHLLIAGMNGGGKSFELAIILANILYYQAKWFDIYLCQTVKRDIDYLKDCKSVKKSVYTPLETANTLEKAFEEIDRRAKVFANIGVRGIDHYNEVSDSKMKRKLYIFEEISLYMPDDTDDEEEKKEKTKVWTLLWKLVKLGREVGINVFMLTQRTTAKNLGGDGEIKSQLARMTFYQAQEIDSRNVIDNDLATKLKEQECYVLTTKGLALIKVPFLSDGLASLKKYIPEIVAHSKDDIIKPIEKVEKGTHRLKKESIEVEFEHVPIEEYKNSKKQDKEIDNESTKEIDKDNLVIENNVINLKVKKQKTKKRTGVEFE